MASTIRNPNFWYTDKNGVDHYYDDKGTKGRTIAAPTSSSSSSKSTTTTPKPTTTTAPKPVTTTAAPAPTPTTSTSTSNAAAIAAAQEKVRQAAAQVNPMDPQSFIALNLAQAQLAQATAAQSPAPAPTTTAPKPATTTPKPATTTPSTGATYSTQSTSTGGNRFFVQDQDSMGNTTGGHYEDALGNYLGVYDPSKGAPDAPLRSGSATGTISQTQAGFTQTGAQLYPDNPRAAAAYDKAIAEGQSYVTGGTRTAADNARMAKDSANFWVNNPLAFIEGPINDFLTSNPAGQAVAPVLANGVPVASIGGSAGPQTPLDTGAIIGNAAGAYQNNQPSPIPTNPTGTYNGTGSTSPAPISNTPLANGTASGPAPTWGTNPGTPAPGTVNATGTPTPTATGTPAPGTNAPTGDVPWWQNPAALAAVSGALSAGGSLVSGSTVGNAATEAAKLQNDQFNKVLDLQKTQYDQQRADTKPWLDAGSGALNKLGTFFTDNPDFGMSQFQADPGYSFRLSEGMKALQNSAAARGGLLSGNTMKGIQDYGQGMASQEYQNAYSRYNQNRNTKLNALQSTAGLGQTAVNQSNQASQNYTQSAGNAMTGGANALAGGVTGAANAHASGYMGATSALTNALSTYLDYDKYTQRQNMVNSLLGGY